ncbi:MAG: T9SS type A sorting domain-containing protein, partial [Candidatus Kapabacteria bacterium]|nr:T9SS type A sorting domain-containing protein [Candidatus Kapabacteria bacterium]
LGVSPGGLLGEGPLWSCIIAGRNSSGDTSNITCFVPADDNTGEAVCIGLPTSVETTTDGTFTIAPNPVADVLTINVPVELYSPDVTISVNSLLGEQIANYPMTNVMGGASIVVPTNTLANGTYFITYRSATLTKTQQFTVSR